MGTVYCPLHCYTSSQTGVAGPGNCTGPLSLSGYAIAHLRESEVNIIMSMWSSNPASVQGTKKAAGTMSSLDNAPAVIVYPNSDGTTGGSHYNYTSPNFNGSDSYGGIPININTGSSAEGLQSLSGVLNNGFEGLFDLISKNTDKNNAWSAAQAQKQMSFQERMNQIAMDFNAGEAAKNRDWQEYLSNTAHQREVADLKAAGLNPVLSASGGNGASVGSGAAASVSSPAGAKGDTDTSANSALVGLYSALISAQTQMYNANLAAKTNMYMSDRQVEASMYGAQMAANASMYGSQMAYNGTVYGQDQATLRQREMNEYNEKHPQTLTQGAFSLPGLVDDMADWLKEVKNGSISGRNKSRTSHGSNYLTSMFLP